MAHEFKLTRRIEFFETDLAGIVHFSNFYRMMESTEHAFFRSLQLAPPLNLQSLLQPPTPTAGHTPLISPGLGDPTP